MKKILVGKNGRLKRNGGSKTIEAIVKERYAQGAQRREDALCCPVSYDKRYLEVIPQEIIEKDYGCGDPTAYVREGDIVLDLGSGTGKVCYIVSQIVGPKGKVIGVDFNPAMLELARRYEKEVGDKIGWHNVLFVRGRIQDLKTDIAYTEKLLKEKPVHTVEEHVSFEEACEEAREQSPLIANESVDVILSNCVLNLVKTQDKKKLFREMFRVLKRGGRVAISDIVSDAPVPEEMRRDPDLWSGCISGAFQEKAFVRAFEEAGFYGITIQNRDELPWRVVEGIEFRSMTLTAYKGKEGACWERNQAVVYKGPWKCVEDDDSHVLHRGVRTAVCDKTFQIFSKEPYREELIPVPPQKTIPLSKARPFDCSRSPERDVQETKGAGAMKTTLAKASCPPGECC